MSKVPQAQLDALNAKVKAANYVDREHLLEFLTIIPTSDGEVIVQEVRAWLTELHNNPEYERVSFPSGDIDAIISDLDSYGRVQPETILKYKQSSNKTLSTS